MLSLLINITLSQFMGVGPEAACSSSQAFTAPIVAEVDDKPKKPPGQIIRYNREFLLNFMDVSEWVTQATYFLVMQLTCSGPARC